MDLNEFRRSSGGEYGLSFLDLTEISEVAAKSLSKHHAGVCLGLYDISDSVAEELSKCKEVIDLPYLAELSDAAAESLGKTTAYELTLSGLTELSDAATSPPPPPRSSATLGMGSDRLAIFHLNRWPVKG